MLRTCYSSKLKLEKNESKKKRAENIFNAVSICNKMEKNVLKTCK